jgi:GNAT superfamily N-acetyltransferase
MARHATRVTLVLAPARLDDAVAVTLTAASTLELDARYDGWPGSGPEPRPEEFVAPDGAFLLARLDGDAVGCGGVSRIDAETAEIRRVYLAPQARGHGHAKTLVTALIEAAADLGYTRVRLETGNRQPEAIGLYARLGFERIPCWGPYATDARSLCFELVLAPVPTTSTSLPPPG